MPRSRSLFLAVFVFLAALAVWLVPRFVHPSRTQLTLALLEASNDGNTPRVRELLAQGADVNAKRGDVQPGERVEEPGYVNYVDPTTPLMAAFTNSHVETCEVLLKHGANPNAKNPAGYPLIVLAGNQRERRGLVEMLLRHGANVNASANLKAYSGFSTGGVTILSEAISADDVELVRTLIAHGANVRKRGAANGYSPLREAVEFDHGKTEIVQMLLDAGVMRGLTTAEREILLTAAASHRFDKVTQILKKYSAQR